MTSAYQDFTDRAQAAWACVALLQHAETWTIRLLTREKQVGLKSTFRDSSDILVAAKRAPAHRKGAAASYRYLLPRGHVEHLSFQHKGGQAAARHMLGVSNVVHYLAKRHYFAPGSPMATYLTHDVSDHFQSALAWLHEKLASNNSGTWFADALAIAEERAGVSSKQGTCEHFLQTTFSDAIKFCDPDFPNLRAWEYESAATTFSYGEAVDAEPKWDLGVYAVLREARGPMVEKGTDLMREQNVIVRDFLWLGSDDKGLYYSSYDDRLYDIALTRSPGRTGTNLRIDGKSADTGGEHHLHLSFPEPPGGGEPPKVLDAILTGTGATRFDIAAWKVLLARPLAPATRRLAALLRLKGGAADTRDLSRLLKHSGFAWRFSKENGNPARMAFRRILASHESVEPVTPLGGELRAILRGTLLDILENDFNPIAALTTAEPEMIVEDILDQINKVIRQRWFEIGPAQIVTFITRNANAVDDGPDLFLLLKSQEVEADPFARVS